MSDLAASKTFDYEDDGNAPRSTFLQQATFVPANMSLDHMITSDDEHDSDDDLDLYKTGNFPNLSGGSPVPKDESKDEPIFCSIGFIWQDDIKCDPKTKNFFYHQQDVTNIRVKLVTFIEGIDEGKQNRPIITQIINSYWDFFSSNEDLPSVGSFVEYIGTIGDFRRGNVDAIEKRVLYKGIQDFHTINDLMIEFHAEAQQAYKNHFAIHDEETGFPKECPVYDLIPLTSIDICTDEKTLVDYNGRDISERYVTCLGFVYQYHYEHGVISVGDIANIENISQQLEIDFEYYHNPPTNGSFCQFVFQSNQLLACIPIFTPQQTHEETPANVDDESSPDGAKKRRGEDYISKLLESYIDNPTVQTIINEHIDKAEQYHNTFRSDKCVKVNQYVNYSKRMKEQNDNPIPYFLGYSFNHDEGNDFYYDVKNKRCFANGRNVTYNPVKILGYVTHMDPKRHVPVFRDMFCRLLDYYCLPTNIPPVGSVVEYSGALIDFMTRNSLAITQNILHQKVDNYNDIIPLFVKHYEEAKKHHHNLMHDHTAAPTAVTPTHKARKNSDKEFHSPHFHPTAPVHQHQIRPECTVCDIIPLMNLDTCMDTSKESTLKKFKVQKPAPTEPSSVSDNADAHYFLDLSERYVSALAILYAHDTENKTFWAVDPIRSFDKGEAVYTRFLYGTRAPMLPPLGTLAQFVFLNGVYSSYTPVIVPPTAISEDRTLQHSSSGGSPTHLAKLFDIYQNTGVLSPLLDDHMSKAMAYFNNPSSTTAISLNEYAKQSYTPTIQQKIDKMILTHKLTYPTEPFSTQLSFILGPDIRYSSVSRHYVYIHEPHQDISNLWVKIVTQSSSSAIFDQPPVSTAATPATNGRSIVPSTPSTPSANQRGIRSSSKAPGLLPSLSNQPSNGPSGQSGSFHVPRHASTQPLPSKENVKSILHDITGPSYINYYIPPSQHSDSELVGKIIEYVGKLIDFRTGNAGAIQKRVICAVDPEDPSRSNTLNAKHAQPWASLLFQHYQRSEEDFNARFKVPKYPVDLDNKSGSITRESGAIEKNSPKEPLLDTNGNIIYSESPIYSIIPLPSIAMCRNINSALQINDYGFDITRRYVSSLAIVKGVDTERNILYVIDPVIFSTRQKEKVAVNDKTDDMLELPQIYTVQYNPQIQTAPNNIGELVSLVFRKGIYCTFTPICSPKTLTSLQSFSSFQLLQLYTRHPEFSKIVNTHQKAVEVYKANPSANTSITIDQYTAQGLEVQNRVCKNGEIDLGDVINDMGVDSQPQEREPIPIQLNFIISPDVIYSKQHSLLLYNNFEISDVNIQIITYYPGAVTRANKPILRQMLGPGYPHHIVLPEDVKPGAVIEFVGKISDFRVGNVDKLKINILHDDVLEQKKWFSILLDHHKISEAAYNKYFKSLLALNVAHGANKEIKFKPTITYDITALANVAACQNFKERRYSACIAIISQIDTVSHKIYLSDPSSPTATIDIKDPLSFTAFAYSSNVHPLPQLGSMNLIVFIDGRYSTFSPIFSSPVGSSSEFDGNTISTKLLQFYAKNPIFKDSLYDKHYHKIQGSHKFITVDEYTAFGAARQEVIDADYAKFAADISIYDAANQEAVKKAFEVATKAKQQESDKKVTEATEAPKTVTDEKNAESKPNTTENSQKNPPHGESGDETHAPLNNPKEGGNDCCNIM